MSVHATASVNGGPPQGGAVTLNDGDSVQFGLSSYIGVGVITWEIYSQPDEFDVPAGWTAATGRIYWTGNANTGLIPPTVDFTEAPWGKYLVRATVNHGLSGSALDLEATRDDSLALQLSGPIEDVAPLETNQFDPVYGIRGSIRKALRALVLRIGDIVPATAGLVRSTGTELQTTDVLDVGTDIGVRTSTIRWESGYSPFLSQDVAASGNGSWFTIQAQSSTDGSGGDLNLFAGSGSTNGGSVLVGGSTGASGSGGDVVLFSAGGGSSGSIREYVGGSPTGGGTLMRSVDGSGHHFHGDVAIGEEPATAGTVRLPAECEVVAASAVSPGTNVSLIALVSSDNLYVGDGVDNPITHVRASESVRLQVGGTTLLSVSEGGHDFHGKPLKNARDARGDEHTFTAIANTSSPSLRIDGSDISIAVSRICGEDQCNQVRLLVEIEDSGFPTTAWADEIIVSIRRSGGTARLTSAGQNAGSGTLYVTGPESGFTYLVTANVGSDAFFIRLVSETGSKRCVVTSSWDAPRSRTA